MSEEEERKAQVKQEIVSFIQHLSKRHSTEESPHVLPKNLKPNGPHQFWLLNKREIKNLTKTKIGLAIDLQELMPKQKESPKEKRTTTPRTPTTPKKFRFAQNYTQIKQDYEQIIKSHKKEQPQEVPATYRSTKHKASKSNIGVSQKQHTLPDYVPIHKRYQDEIQRREEKLEQSRKRQKELEERYLQQLSFRPNIDQGKDRYQTWDDFLKSQEEWQKSNPYTRLAIREGHINYLQEIQDKQMRNQCSHSPHISSKSQEIVEKRNHFNSYKKPEDRLLDSEKKKINRLEAQRQQLVPPFKPEINPKSRQLAEDKLNRSRLNVTPPTYYPPNFIV